MHCTQADCIGCFGAECYDARSNGCYKLDGTYCGDAMATCYTDHVGGAAPSRPMPNRKNNIRRNSSRFNDSRMSGMGNNGRPGITSSQRRMNTRDRINNTTRTATNLSCQEAQELRNRGYEFLGTYGALRDPSYDDHVPQFYTELALPITDFNVFHVVDPGMGYQSNYHHCTSTRNCSDNFDWEEPACVHEAIDQYGNLYTFNETGAGFNHPGCCVRHDINHAYYPGDVNQDRSINVVDITKVVNHVLFDFPGSPNALNEFQKRLADLNYDREINITDIVLLVDKVLSQGLITQSQANQIRNTIRKMNR